MSLETKLEEEILERDKKCVVTTDNQEVKRPAVERHVDGPSMGTYASAAKNGSGGKPNNQQRKSSIIIIKAKEEHSQLTSETIKEKVSAELKPHIKNVRIRGVRENKG